MKMTVDVVPSPLVSSWATAVRAIIMAVGLCICCHKKNDKLRMNTYIRHKFQYYFQQKKLASIQVVNFSTFLHNNFF